MLEKFFDWLETTKNTTDFHMANVGNFAIDNYDALKAVFTENSNDIILIIFFGILSFVCIVNCFQFNKNLETLTLKKI